MKKPATTITELAQSIILDDVTDVFYRSLVYPFFNRCEMDEKTELQKALDDKLELKLGRQLQWTAALTSLDTATHKFSHFVERVYERSLTQAKMDEMLATNYWLKTALEQTQMSLGLAKQINAQMLRPEEGVKSRTYEILLATCWHYFNDQLSSNSGDMLLRIAELSDKFIEAGMALAEEKYMFIAEDDFYQLALFNAYPMVVLLRLFDKSVQSSKQDLLNIVGMENKAEREKVEAYEPNADILLNFFIFDEFVKPHILESINLDSKIQSNLIMGQDELTPVAKLFLRGRTKVIKDMLAANMVLTTEQMARFKEQLGIEYHLSKQAQNDPRMHQVLSKLLTF